MLSSTETEAARWAVALDDIEADNTVNLYLHEMAREPLLSAEEEIELARCIERGNRAATRLAAGRLGGEERAELERQTGAANQARSRFIRANTRLVVSIAKAYTDRGMPLLDLIQEGNLGLMHAVEKFDPGKGNRFSTYATWWIRQAINRALADQARTIRIPVHTIERMRRIQSVARWLETCYGRQPTAEEIAESMELSPEDVRRLLTQSQHPLSLEEPVDEMEERELGHLIEDTSALSPSEAAAQHLLAEEVRELLTFLQPHEAQVLSWRYGLQDGEGRSLEEVGERLGLSRERIRQIESVALRKLRRAAQKRWLNEY